MVSAAPRRALHLNFGQVDGLHRRRCMLNASPLPDDTLPLICTRGVWASPALSDCVRPKFYV
eukprot:scaffold55679_cov83-Phaeocystis_antarctica.AAC.1